MRAADAVAWVCVLGAALGAVAAAQCLKLHILRRWHAHVHLPDPVAYVDAPSICSDADLQLCLHSSKPVYFTFHRCAATGFVPTWATEAEASPGSARMHRWTGFDWQPALVVPAGTLDAGFYRIDVVHRDDPSARWCFCLLVAAPEPAAVVVVASTNTWNAYNDFGGLSNYRDYATPLPLRLIWAVLKPLNLRICLGDRYWLPSVPLPERRPNTAIHRDLIAEAANFSHLARAEATLVRFLERERIDHTIVSDRDFAFRIGVGSVRAVIFNTHAEYWSEEMIGRVAEMIDRGISIIFLSGNNIYRKVQFMDKGISVIQQKTTPEQVVPLIGAYYDAYGYLTYAGYRVTDATHWSYEGLGVHEGSTFGEATRHRRGASGHETDKIRSQEKGFRVVAVGENVEGPAFMVCRDLPNGAFVFSAGSVAFTACLDDDRVAQHMVRNLVYHALAAGSVSV